MDYTINKYKDPQSVQTAHSRVKLQGNALLANSYKATIRLDFDNTIYYRWLSSVRNWAPISPCIKFVRTEETIIFHWLQGKAKVHSIKSTEPIDKKYDTHRECTREERNCLQRGGSFGPDWAVHWSNSGTSLHKQNIRYLTRRLMKKQSHPI